MVSQILSPLLAGLFGALISAALSYVVRLRAKSREDLNRRKKVAQVNYLLLTDIVAAQVYVKEFVSKLAALIDIKTDGFGIEHAVAAKLAELMDPTDPELLGFSARKLAPFLNSIESTASRLAIPIGDLAEMPELTIYCYHRFITVAGRAKTGVEMIKGILADGEVKTLDAKALIALYQTYRNYANAAGVLRAAFAKTAEVSSAYSTFCLQRSYTAVQKEVLANLENDAKLTKARSAAEATRGAASVLSQDAVTADMPEVATT